MNSVTARPLTAVLCCAALALAGCTSATNDQASPETTTTTTTTEASPTTSLRPECADVADAVQALVTEVGRFATGGATAADVKAAADALSTAFGDARDTLGPEAQANLDQAGQSLQRIQDALAAQPVDRAELRQAASELFASLGDAAAVCAAGSATSSPTTESSETETETETTTS